MIARIVSLATVIVAAGIGVARATHPMVAPYLGIFLAPFGELIHWPTIPRLALSPFIVCAYVRLARREEREPVARFDAQYRAYQRRVPMFWPRAGQWRRLFGLPVARRV